MMDDDTPLQDLLNTVVLRCPNCHEGRMYASFYEMHETCPVCGIVFEPSPGVYTGAMMFGWGLIFTIGLFGYFFLHVFAAAPAWAEWAWLLFWAAAFPLLFYRNIKAVWVGVLYVFDRLRPAPGVEPARR